MIFIDIPKQFVGMVFESFIIGIATFLLILILIKYYQKKHRLTLYLFLIFLNYVIAIIFSWLSKVLVLTTDQEYIYNQLAPDPGTWQSWIILRIVDFRFSFVFLTIAILISYILKVNVFGKGYNKIQKYLVILLAGITAGYSFLIYQKGNTLLDAIAFLLVFLFMAVVYFPFLWRSYQSYKLTKERIFKNAFLALALMSIFFILVPLNFLFDRLMILIGGDEFSFSVFYYLGWIFVICGIIGAYYGYIRPKSK
ncbi:MAG: hypothetical protein ACFFBH_12805 [Promethearchaeota archaeon]